MLAATDEISQLLPVLIQLEQDALNERVAGATGLKGDVARHRKLGEYSIVREIGRGGMGVVFEAVQESLGRRFALKVLWAGGMLDSQRERFVREAQAAAK